MLGDVLANFSPDPLKKVKALNKVVDEVKLAKKAEMKLSPIVGEVDEFGRLRSGDVVGDQLENHHVPQKAIAKNSVVDYPKDKDAVTAPAIRLSEEDHLLITKLQKANQAQRSKMTARELLADDARMLRSIGVENAKIAQIIEMNKAKYGFTK